MKGRWCPIYPKSPNLVSRYLPHMAKNLSVHKNLPTKFGSSFIYKSPNLEATMMLFSKWMKTLWCIGTVEYYSRIKRNELSSREKMQRDFKCILHSERKQSEKSTHYVILTIWRFRKRYNYRDSRRITGCQGAGGEGEEGRLRWGTWHFWVVKLFCMIP